jgi:hypothetical protein
VEEAAAASDESEVDEESYSYSSTDDSECDASDESCYEEESSTFAPTVINNQYTQQQHIAEQAGVDYYDPSIPIYEETEQQINEVVIQVEVDADTLDARDVETNKTTQIIIGATVGVIVLLVVCFIGYSLRNYMNADRIEQEKVHEIQKEVQMARAKSAAAKANVDEVDHVIDQFRTNETEQKLKTEEIEEGAVLEEQYNPLHDFAVFGVGN